MSFIPLAAAAASTETLRSLVIEFIGRVFAGKESILYSFCYHTQNQKLK